MPDILIGSLEATEPDGDAEQSLASPQVAGSDCGFPQLKCLGGVNQHLNWFFHTGLEQVFQGVVVFVLQEKNRGEMGEQRVTADTNKHLWLQGALLTSLVLLMETIKSKKGSSPARCPGEFS